MAKSRCRVKEIGRKCEIDQRFGVKQIGNKVYRAHSCCRISDKNLGM